MKHWMILLILLLVSSSFLLLQIVYLRGLDTRKVSSGFGFLSRSQALRSEEDDISWVTLRKFLFLAKEYGLSIFVIDPYLLKVLISDVNSTTFYSDCQVVCRREKFLLGVMESSWLQKNSFTAEAKQRGFHWSCSEGQDPRIVSVNSFSSKAITLQCWFTYEGTVELQLVIFYQRHSYLWHGPLQKTLQGQGIPPSKATPAVIAGAYDNFSLAEATIDKIPVKVPEGLVQFLSAMQQAWFLECDLEQARHFYTAYGDDRSPEAVKFRQQARKLIVVAKQALDELGVRFWLSSGTCLGWFRQCGLIPHSKDVDLGVWIKDYNPRLVSEFQRKGLMLKHLFGKVEDSYELSFRTAEHDIKLDIFFFYEEDDYMWNGGTQARTGRKFKYIFPKFALCWTEFLEMKVRVPCPLKPYIEANYGQEWHMPVRAWNWKKSPPNVRENGVWDEKDWDQVIQLFE